MGGTILRIILNFGGLMYISMPVSTLIVMFARTRVFNVTISIVVFMKRTIKQLTFKPPPPLEAGVVIVVAPWSLAAAVFVHQSWVIL